MGPIKAVARGETLVSVSFIHDVVTEAQAGFPVRSVAPCEGTGYEIGSMSIVKGARNLENAKKFYDWALTPKAQALAAQSKQFQLPSNVGTPVSTLSPNDAVLQNGFVIAWCWPRPTPATTRFTRTVARISCRRWVMP